MYLQLYHGRLTPHEKLDDWGFHGPILNDVEWLAVAYMTTFRVKFKTEEAFEHAKQKTGWPQGDYLVLEIPTHAALVSTVEEGITKYYGDWSLDEDEA